MQILFDAGEEHGVTTKGLGLLPGTVARLSAPVVPHMGWNVVDWPSSSALGAGVEPGTRFYFVHSYAAPGTVDGASVARTTHGDTTFAAAVERGALWATQFHPEKSGDAGAALLATWVGTLRA
jgi:glutamine amidotransferase